MWLVCGWCDDFPHPRGELWAAMCVLRALSSAFAFVIVVAALPLFVVAFLCERSRALDEVSASVFWCSVRARVMAGEASFSRPALHRLPCSISLPYVFFTSLFFRESSSTSGSRRRRRQR